ncbi:MAG: cation-transporting P-type ATPase [Candidatus Nanohaloarchaeota archaeon QJJ-5]|nr:cation-transporting P-type ATPase [Candidatus Nanohaloarchaeota archaeon QJJ-5]
MSDEQWHAQELDETFETLETSDEGLSSEEAEKRLEEHGKNEIDSGEEISPFWIFVDQFRDFLVYLLIFAALVSIGVGLFEGHDPEWVDAILIMLILLGNGIFGFFQDYKAEKSIEALRDLSSPNATVLRDGEKQKIDSRNVVPGDIVFLSQGDAIPADVRIIEDSNLETDEAALTGESTQVTKEASVLDEETPLAERTNMAFMNTSAVKGRGKAVVVSTGMETQVGDIAEQITEAEDKETPFEEEVDHLGKQIGYGIMLIIAFVALFQGIFTNASLISVVLVAISLAVAAVPEGLPAVVTLTLALGSKKMLKQNALVRRLPVVESLGSIDVIVTDKTGTLTEDRMTVEKIHYNDSVYNVTGGATGEGGFERDDESVESDELEEILRCGALCNNAEQTTEGEWLGDPTEVAIKVAAQKGDIETDEQRVREIPFSSARKRMTVITDTDTAYMKGAPSYVLERCDRIRIDGEEQELTDDKREQILEQNEAFAEDALRVLGFAKKAIDDREADDEDIENDMIFLGLQGMIDPPREEVKRAVEDCREAGIKVIMATGDNKKTAQAVGEQVGFSPDGALTGTEVEELTDEQLQDRVKETEVFARVSPSHKVRILKALQANGHRVAMTGDGVNDAPALKNSDVGISMGQRGTDVAKQSSDMVLQDDNFVTIRNAIAEGRGIFDNIRKFVSYLLSYNAGEVLLVFFGTLLGSFLFPDIFQEGSEALVLTPVMLLWINLVTDGLPALALGADPKVPAIMDRPPRDKDEPVIDKRMFSMIAGIGTLMTVTILPLFFYNLHQGEGMMLAQTMAFTALVVFEMIGIQAIRRVYNMSVFSNKWLWISVAGALGLHLVVLYSPLNTYFQVVPLGLINWLEIGGALLVFFILVEGLIKIQDRIFVTR